MSIPLPAWLTLPTPSQAVTAAQVSIALAAVQAATDALYRFRPFRKPDDPYFDPQSDASAAAVKDAVARVPRSYGTDVRTSPSLSPEVTSANFVLAEWRRVRYETRDTITGRLTAATARLRAQPNARNAFVVTDLLKQARDMYPVYSAPDPSVSVRASMPMPPALGAAVMDARAALAAMPQVEVPVGPPVPVYTQPVAGFWSRRVFGLPMPLVVIGGIGLLLLLRGGKK